MTEPLENTLMPVDDVAWQNAMYMAQGVQACVGYDGVVRPFEIPLSVRKGWAKSGERNPYTNRVETELLADPEPPPVRVLWWRRWIEGMKP